MSGEHDDVELSASERIMFAKAMLETHKRVVFCSPELESRVKGYIAAHGAAGIFEVRVIEALGDDKVFIIDENALEAESEEYLQRLSRKPIRIYPDDEGPPRFAGYF